MIDDMRQPSFLDQHRQHNGARVAQRVRDLPHELGEFNTRAAACREHAIGAGAHLGPELLEIAELWERLAGRYERLADLLSANGTAQQRKGE